MIYMRNITITTAKSATYLENVGLERAKRDHFLEISRQNDFEEVALEFRVAIYSGALDGSEQLSGWAGIRIVRDLRELKREWETKIEVGEYDADAPTLDQLLIRFAEQTRLEPNGQGHSYCSCTNSEKDLSAARCIEESQTRDPNALRRQGPDLRFAADTTCAACPHNVQLPENRPYWEEALRDAQATCLTCPGTVLEARMAERARIANEHLARFHRG